ncbi:ParB/RepB/Spo0J family partition protein [Vibrio neptunius]|uniref:ParB/RepB/Spo0J family partition protein n=1 Tax=Vibrio neptunius TaxID=170651 RepID=UPI003CE5550E
MSLRQSVPLSAVADLLDESDVEVLQGETIYRIPKSEIYSIEQIRKQFDEASIEEMANSLEIEGQIQPIIVSERDGRGYCIEKGERRWRGALSNDNITHLDCIIRARGTIWGQLAENIIREDLTPFEVGMAIIEGKQQHQLDNQGVAKRLGMSVPKVSAFVNATLAPTVVKQAYQDGLIGDVDSINCLRIAHELDPKATEQLLASSHGVSRKQAQALTRDLKRATQGTAQVRKNPSPAQRPSPSVAKSIRVKTERGFGVIDMNGIAEQGEVIVLLDELGQAFCVRAAEVQLIGYHIP